MAQDTLVDDSSGELARSLARLRVLAEASHAFATVATDTQQLLDRIVRTTAELVGDGCAVTLIDPGGVNLYNAACAHRDPSIEAAYRSYLAGVTVPKLDSATVSATVIRTGQARLAAVTPADMVARTDEALRPLVARLDVHSFAVMPIRAHGAVLGSLSLFRSGGGRDYAADDLILLQDLADRAGLAIANARLYDELERRVRERTSELEAVNRELEAFSYSVAHDLRAPLRSIDGFSQALLEDCGDRVGADGEQYLARVRAAAQRMALLIDGLLDLSRVSRAELHREPVDVTALARSILAHLRHAHPERVVETLIAPGLVASADPRLLEAVLMNLLGNAWKFTGLTPSARIELAAVPGGHATVFRVRDNGAGFDAAYVGKLFGVFQRLHGAREFEGTGIGLATVQRIVHRHGGRVWAEGAVGAGASFYFTLESEA